MRNKKGQFKKGHHWRKPKLWWDKEWLKDQYINCGKSAIQIATEGGVTENAIFYWLSKHNIKRRSMTEIRAEKKWGLFGSDNPMWNRKGELNPNWAGGITPERQLFYQSAEWKTVCQIIWKRDNATCCRCGLYKEDSKDMPYHIHHIESFANRELRADADNLVLLCEACHHFVHSKRNIERAFLPKK